MNSVKILDCTLRDGGYINKWCFGKQTIKAIINLLQDTNIEYIECGFLTEKSLHLSNDTLFNSISQLDDYLPQKRTSTYSLMVNYGEIPIEKIDDCSKSDVIIRVAFKKHQIDLIESFSNQLKYKGYKVSLNPMHTSIYSEEDLIKLVYVTNAISPISLTVVDTMGIMTEFDTFKLFSFLDDNLDRNIAIGFHAHNNMQMAFANTKKMIMMGLDREIIIDSCVSGMGRGAGILPTELITQYLNDVCDNKYSLKNISDIANKYIHPIELKTGWGYSYPYYLSAKNRCHPNYAKYLIDNSAFSYDEMNNIFAAIPDEYKTMYDESVIKNIILTIDNNNFIIPLQ